jgi:hypothetical protein
MSNILYAGVSFDHFNLLNLFNERKGNTQNFTHTRVGEGHIIGRYSFLDSGV